jgi:hypothetical protein
MILVFSLKRSQLERLLLPPVELRNGIDIMIDIWTFLISDIGDMPLESLDIVTKNIYSALPCA